MIINRKFALASHATFTIPPIKDLLKKYNVGIGWVDPFAGYNSPAEWTNDLDDNAPTKAHLEADKFCMELGVFLPLKGVLFDPPYSYRQISEHYKAFKKKATALDTSYNFYGRVMDAITPKMPLKSLAISFGWNSNGFGKKRGFEIEEILLVAHGLHHNDTICTVERKVR